MALTGILQSGAPPARCGARFRSKTHRGFPDSWWQFPTKRIFLCVLLIAGGNSPPKGFPCVFCWSAYQSPVSLLSRCWGRGGRAGVTPLLRDSPHNDSFCCCFACTPCGVFFCFHSAAVGKKITSFMSPAQGLHSDWSEICHGARRSEPTQKARHGHGKYLLCLKIGVLCGVTWLGTAPTPPCPHCCFCWAAPWGMLVVCCFALPSPSSRLPGGALHFRFHIKNINK